MCDRNSVDNPSSKSRGIAVQQPLLPALQESSPGTGHFDRRAFLKGIAGIGFAAAIAADFSSMPAQAQTAGTQTDWRYCVKCHSLFFNGARDKGTCPAGGGHDAAGLNFILPHDVTNGQKDWRMCSKCHVLFYAASPTQSRCPMPGLGRGPGQHVAEGYNFALPFNGGGQGQSNWRFCGKCHGLFFDGYPSKGKCPAGGAHSALGWNFVLNFQTVGPIANVLEFDFNPIVFKTGVAVGGWSHLTLYPDGHYHFTGHFHDSGAPSYNAGLACMLRSRSGQAFLFSKSGHMNGTFESGSRDFDWDASGTNEDIKRSWADLAGGKLEWRADVNADIDGIISAVKKAVEVVGDVIKVIEVVA